MDRTIDAQSPAAMRRACRQRTLCPGLDAPFRFTLTSIMIKRLTATLMIFAWALMSVESVVGEMRDGDVHHESVSKAMQHRVASAGGFAHEHGEEPGLEEQGDEQDRDHQHGSSTDHCTHVHGAALIIMAVPVTPTSVDHAWNWPSPSSNHFVPAEVLPHPPKV